MSVIYITSLVNTRLQDVVTAIDAGGGNGWLRIFEASTLISSLQLARPCGVVSSKTITFNGMPLVDPAAITTGIPTLARIEDSAGNIVIGGLTVGAGPGNDIILTSANPNPSQIIAGQTVAIQTATITGV